MSEQVLAWSSEQIHSVAWRQDDLLAQQFERQPELCLGVIPETRYSHKGVFVFHVASLRVSAPPGPVSVADVKRRARADIRARRADLQLEAPGIDCIRLLHLVVDRQIAIRDDGEGDRA